MGVKSSFVVVRHFSLVPIFHPISRQILQHHTTNIAHDDYSSQKKRLSGWQSTKRKGWHYTLFHCIVLITSLSVMLVFARNCNNTTSAIRWRNTSNDEKYVFENNGDDLWLWYIDSDCLCCVETGRVLVTILLLHVAKSTGKAIPSPYAFGLVPAFV